MTEAVSGRLARWSERLALRDALRSFLELVGLSGIAITQPVLDSFGRGGDIFVARGAGFLDIIAFALLVAVLPALLATVAEVVAGLINPRLARGVHAVAVAVLLTVIAIQIFRETTDLGDTMVVVASVVAALLVTAAVIAFSIARVFLRFLAVATVFMVGSFLFASPVSEAVLSDGRVPAADVEVGAPAPIVWIVFDELPTLSLMGEGDAVDADLFPNFAALADDATWYQNNTTVAPNTPQAVPALLTGKYPKDQESLPIPDEHPQSVFTMLGEQYDLNVSEGWTRVCPTNLCSDHASGSGAAVPNLLMDAAELWWRQASPGAAAGLADLNFRAGTFGNRDDQAEEFPSTLQPTTDSSKPPLDFIHVLFPHYGFNFLPSGQGYRGPAFPTGMAFGGWYSPEIAAAARQRHLLQLQYTDKLLGGILERLKEIDRYDESLIVLTVDHGAAFTHTSPMRGVSEGNYHEVMWTPLLIKAPGQRTGTVDDRPSRSIDILPTVIDHIDVDSPWKMDGRSLLRDERPTGRPRVLDWNENQLEPNAGEYIKVNGREGYARLLAADPIPGSPDDPLRLYRLAPYGDLVGRSVEDLPTGDAVTLSGWVDDLDAYDDVDPEGKDVPAYLSGQFQISGTYRRRFLAVALNGRIAGWSEIYAPGYLVFGNQPGREGWKWWTMVPPEFLNRGRNEVAFYLMEGEPDSVELRPLRVG